MKSFEEPQDGILLDEAGFVKIKELVELSIDMLELMRKRRQNAINIHKQAEGLYTQLITTMRGTMGNKAFYEIMAPFFEKKNDPGDIMS